DADFAAGDFDTGFIARHPDLLALDTTPPAAAIAAAALHVLAQPAATPDAEPHSPWSVTDAWRMNLPGAIKLNLLCGEATILVRATAAGEDWQLAWGDERHLGRLTGGLLRLDDTTLPVTIVPGDILTVLVSGRTIAITLLDPLAPPRAAPPGADHVLAPIPGRITSVLVQPGDVVARGQTLIVLEAMKMEMSLTASMDGTIAAVRCAVGDMVQEGADLVDFAATDAG
ncbi:MAG: biotin/lipoyl-binding protein, partial [Alphaproteobacteria bacterium]|nr:biotin/lipoyl-binding protein [Alphaproteobacteria bacterium]